jgi:hypothetical protein
MYVKVNPSNVDIVYRVVKVIYTIGITILLYIPPEGLAKPG